MGYRLAIIPGCKYREHWIRFAEYYEFDERMFWDILESEHHGENVPGTEFIEFETEEDAIAFILKWS